MIATILLAALSLPDDVGAPPPGDLTLMLGFDRRPFAEVRFGLLRWLGVRVEGELGEAPRLGAELRVAAVEGGSGLAAHTWFRGHVRPKTDEAEVSSYDLGLGVGVVGRLGDAFLRIDGGVIYGIVVEPVSVSGLPRSAADQQGGLFFTQSVTVGYDLAKRFSLDIFLEAAVPTSVLTVDPTDEDLLRETDARLGARIGVRF